MLGSTFCGLYEIMSIRQEVDPDAGVNILRFLQKIMSSRWQILMLGSTLDSGYTCTWQKAGM
jgi:hypothetical protein